jgi:hypothetical protein
LGKRAVPRGSKPGERRGGRQRGTPNKKTALRNAAHAAAAANPEILPLEFLLGIMRDPDAPHELRIKAAQVTLPFVHARPASARPGDPPGTAKLIDGSGAFTVAVAVAEALRDDYHRLGELVRKKCGDPLSAAEAEEESRIRARIKDRAGVIGCPAGYGLEQAQKDSSRLHELHCKRISPPSYGGGALSEAEDAEEAQLRARLAAFEESPEGCARRRIRELEMQGFGGGRSPPSKASLTTYARSTRICRLIPTTRSRKRSRLGAEWLLRETLAHPSWINQSPQPPSFQPLLGRAPIAISRESVHVRRRAGPSKLD